MVSEIALAEATGAMVRAGALDSSRLGSLRAPRWLIFHAVMMGVLGIAWLLDPLVYSWSNRWYNGPVPVNGELHQLVLSLAMYGQTLGFVISLALIALFDQRHRGRAYLLGVLIVSAGFISSSAKSMVGRERPLQSGGQTVLHGWKKGLTQSRNQSFPSGHTATAFAMSYGLAHCYPATRWMVWTLAGGVALNRVITVRHFLSDVVAGAWIGLVVAAGLFRLRIVQQWSEWISRMLAPKEGPVPVPLRRFVARRSARRVLSSPILLACVCLAMYWCGNGQTPLWDRDEPRFATATREMQSRGDWIVPTFNGELRPDKPILAYWLMGLSYRLLGDGPFAARCASGIAAMLACLVTARLGREMFDRRVGLVAGWILALSPMVVIEAKLATVDALQLLWTTLAFFCWWKLIQGPNRLAAMGLWVSLGLAILTKGPVVPGLVLLSALAWSVLRRDASWVRRLEPALGIPLLLTLVLPWPLLVQRATGGDFLRLAFGHHVVNRSMVALEGHRGIPGYYVFTLFAMFAPWSVLLPWMARRHGSRLWQDPRLSFLALWGVTTLVVFEMVQTKLVHYFLPAYPALALLLSAALVGQFAGLGMGVRYLQKWLAPVSVVIAAVLGPAAVLLSAWLFPISMALPATFIAATLSVGGIVVGLLLNQNRFQRAFFVTAFANATAIVVAGGALLPAIGRERVIVRVAERLHDLQEELPVALWSYRDPSLIYNLGHIVPVLDPMNEQPVLAEALDHARAVGRYVCPMTPAQLERMREDPTLETRTIEVVEGRGFWQGSSREVHLVEVRPSANAAEYDAARTRLARLVHPQKTTRLVIPLESKSAARLANENRKYPLNPVFLTQKPGMVR